MDQRNCDEMKMKVVAEKSDELCQGNKQCIKAIKDAIESGSIPLTNSASDLAWSSDNPYKAAAAAETKTDTTTNKATTTDSSDLSKLLGGETTKTDGSGEDAAKGLANLDDKVTSNTNNEGTDKGENVISALGAEKGQEALSQEIKTNEMMKNPVAGTTTPDESTTKNDERMKGILKDVGVSQKDLDTLKNQEAPTVKTETGQPAPTKEEIQKAINTFKRIFYGRAVDQIEGVEKFCAGSSVNIERAVGMLPFMSLTDPFLEYLGYIRDIQNGKI